MQHIKHADLLRIQHLKHADLHVLGVQHMKHAIVIGVHHLFGTTPKANCFTRSTTPRACKSNKTSMLI